MVRKVYVFLVRVFSSYGFWVALTSVLLAVLVALVVASLNVPADVGDLLAVALVTWMLGGCRSAFRHLRLIREEKLPFASKKLAVPWFNEDDKALFVEALVSLENDDEAIRFTFTLRDADNHERVITTGTTTVAVDSVGDTMRARVVEEVAAV